MKKVVVVQNVVIMIYFMFPQKVFTGVMLIKILLLIIKSLKLNNISVKHVVM